VRRGIFSTSNAGAYYTDFYADLGNLDKIDWTAVAASDFRDPLVKKGKQAEFLVLESFPWQLVEEIGVLGSAIEVQVQTILRGAPHQPPLGIRMIGEKLLGPGRHSSLSVADRLVRRIGNGNVRVALPLAGVALAIPRPVRPPVAVDGGLERGAGLPLEIRAAILRAGLGRRSPGQPAGEPESRDEEDQQIPSLDHEVSLSERRFNVRLH
jgi:hypothetical protein